MYQLCYDWIDALIKCSTHRIFTIMNQNFNRNMSTGGVARSHFFASSNLEIAVPTHPSIAFAERFTNGAGQNVVLFRTANPVTWTDAMSLFTRGQVMVTICKGPNADLDEAMFNLMLKGLCASSKWTHHTNRTKFATDALGITCVVSPSPAPLAPLALPPPPTSPVVHEVPVVRAVKRERDEDAL